MNTTENTYRDRFTELEMSLPGFASLPLRHLRQEGMQRFIDNGFPTQRLENWKYTSVKTISQRAYQVHDHGCPGLDPSDLLPYLIAPVGVYRLVFVNGWFSRTLSDLHDFPEGVRVQSMAKVVDATPRTVEPYLENHQPGADQGFTHLNEALWSDGAFVLLSPGIRLDKPLHLLFLTTSSEKLKMTLPRNLIVAGAGSHAWMVESFVTLGHAAHCTNSHSTIILHDQAHVHHLLFLGENHSAQHVGTVETRLMGSSRLDSRLFSFGGERTRQEIHVHLAGEQAQCSLDGLFVGNENQHMDFHTSIHHMHANTRSQQLYKGILDGHAHGVFNGIITVLPHVLHTQSNQLSSNLLLSDTAEIDTKPQLEINSAAVQCSHGATVGSLDPEALFYLQSRGLDASTARSLLIQGFAAELLQRITSIPVQAWIERQFNKGDNHHES
ncbi:MAG: Fe-S cluster assembly protein SufD [Magnetococcales bacterium]|nr:Fe-S cluster assembly protein SufD [Magnetococcales bacterium]